MGSATKGEVRDSVVSLELRFFGAPFASRTWNLHGSPAWRMERLTR